MLTSKSNKRILRSKLLKLKKAHKLTYVDLSNDIGIAFTTIYNFMADYGPITSEKTIDAIEKFLEKTTLKY